MPVVAAIAQTPASDIKINQIKVIGTHNSYHAGIAPNESKVWQVKYPDAYKGLDYQHPPLPRQFDAGVRQIELDIFYIMGRGYLDFARLQAVH